MLSHPDLQRGRACQKAGDFAQAESLYRAALAAEPENPDALHLLGILLHQTGRSADGTGLIEQALRVAPERIDIRMNYGVLLAQSGRLEESAQALERVWREEPDNDTALQNLISVLQVLGCPDQAIALIEGRTDAWSMTSLYHLYGAAERYEAAITTARKILAMDPGNTRIRTELRQTLPLAGVRPEPTDFFPAQREATAGRHIVVAGMRKSASTFVANALTHLSGFQDVSLASGFNPSYDFIDREQLDSVYSDNTVSHTHCPAHEENLQIFEALGVTPIIVTRNIFDNARSYLEWRMNTGFMYEVLYKEYKALPGGEHADFLIDLFIPRQLEFYAGWVYAERAGRVPVTWAPFEDMIKDKPGYFSRILEGIGLPMDLSRIGESVALVEKQNDSRFNKGVVGRGKELFDDAARARIKAMTRHFPSVDFSPIGL